MTEEVKKALELWTLQNLLNISIMLGILTTGLAMIQGYYQSLEKQLTLRVSIELWRVLTVLVVDILLAVVALVGYLVMNPDIMADIKIALPFCPIATILFTMALILRLFHGGHATASKNYFRAVYLMIAACAVNMVGFTFVMEAPSSEYLSVHPSPFWIFIKTTLRSDKNLELSQVTFYACFSVLAVVLVWGTWSAMRQLRTTAREE